VGTIDPSRDIDYRNYVSMGEQIVQILTAVEEKTDVAAASAEEPSVALTPKICAGCGATNEGGKFCEFCGSAL
jgi:hypothetical protein